MATQFCTVVVDQTGPKADAVVILLHGAGDTGPGVMDWANSVLGRQLDFPTAKLLYPSAPVRTYTAARGMKRTVWFDWKKICPDVPEFTGTLNHMCDQLSGVIDEEVQKGTPKSRIVIGGLSMGGAMALHLGYRYHPDVAGVFALSTFLQTDSAVYKHMENRDEARPLPPLFCCHGTRDKLILPSWGQTTFRNLEGAGVYGEFHTYDMAHEMCGEELQQLRSWICDRLGK